MLLNPFSNIWKVVFILIVKSLPQLWNTINWNSDKLFVRHMFRTFFVASSVSAELHFSGHSFVSERRSSSSPWAFPRASLSVTSTDRVLARDSKLSPDSAMSSGNAERSISILPFLERVSMPIACLSVLNAVLVWPWAYCNASSLLLYSRHLVRDASVSGTTSPSSLTSFWVFISPIVYDMPLHIDWLCCID